MSQLWTDTYFPKTKETFIGNTDIVETALKWAAQWNHGTKAKPLFLHGQSGSGKTALAYLIARLNNWDVMELNASDFRTKDVIEKIVGAAALNASFSGKPRLILLDEVDGLQARDRGGAAAIAQIIKESKNPMVLTANDIYGNQKISGLRFVTQPMEFKKINYLSIAKRLREILTAENITYEDEAIKELSKHASGDFRSALLDAQSLSLADKIEMKDIHPFSRDRQEKIFKVMSVLFHSSNLKEMRRAKAASEINTDLLFRWVEENIPRQFKTTSDVSDAFDQLSKAEHHNAHIFRTQHYGFLRYYSDLLSIGAGLPGHEKPSTFTPFQFPTLLSKLSRSRVQRAMKKSLATKIGKKIHSSSRQVIASDLPFFKSVFSNKDKAIELTAEFGFDEKEIAFLLNTVPSTKKVKDIVQKAEEKRTTILLEKREKFSPNHPFSEKKVPMPPTPEAQTSLKGFSQK